MRFLLDTHTLVWFLSGDAQLSSHARQLMDDEANALFVSVASLWESAIKYSIGKMNLGQPFETLFPMQLELNSIELLDIRVDHLHAVSKLPLHHRDPFDRLIVAQALTESLPLISADTILDSYSVQREW